MGWKRQLRTTVLLLLLIAGCLGAGFYVRARDQQTTQPAAEADPVMQEVTDALSRYDRYGANDLATLRQAAADDQPQKAELLFLGLGSPAFTRSLLSSLTANGVTAAFFVTGSEASSGADSLSLIANAGYPIGASYTEGNTALDRYAAKRVLSDFVRASAAIQTIVGVWPSQVLIQSAPSEAVLAAAYASSMTTVTVPTRTVTLAEVDTPELAQALVAQLQRGTLLCIRMSQGDAAPDGLATLCEALAATDLSARAEKQVAAKLPSAEPLKRIYTTERAVAFTFSGLGNAQELSATLGVLKNVNAVGTFFVTRDELTRYPEEVRQILDGGHKLGISVQPTRFSTAAALLQELYKTQESLQTDYGYTDALAVRPAFGNAPELLMDACGAGGFTLFSAMLNAVRTEDIRVTDADAVLEALLPEALGVLQRGAIVHFQMKQYQRDDSLLGEVVKRIATKRNIYAIKPVMEIAANAEEVYPYPLSAEQILPQVLGKIFPGQLSGNPMTAISTRYIGIDWVSTTSFLPGFTAAEIKRLDTTGLVPNQNNEVYLTFDDWGTDQPITELLDVLAAHKAKATFFVRTQNVVYNPNLLRAIAKEGHTIGCHTHTHFPLSNDAGNGKKFTELTETQVTDLKQDLVASYGVLESIVGDLEIGGKPSLSLLFRPPTLAVGKNGLAAVFDCGFTYSVSGNYTSQDYKAASATKLAADLQKNTESGAILIMHMSDTSVYTAAALDLYLSEMERKYAEKPSRFVGLGSALK